MEKRIPELINRANVSNIHDVAKEILNQENLIQGRGLFCKAIMKSQMDFPELTNVYTSIVAIINSEFPEIGLLLVKRVVSQCKEAFFQNDKEKLDNISNFIAHLVNQSVVYELLAIDVLLLFLGNPSLDNMEIAVRFFKQCGSLLQDLAPHKLKELFQEFRSVSRLGGVKKRVKVLISRLFTDKKWNFDEYCCPSFVEEEDQVIHEVSLLHDIDTESEADVFKPDCFGDKGFVNRTMVLYEDSEDDEVNSLKI